MARMRFSLVRLKMPTNTKLWQDPVLGYFETHGKMRFIAGEDYGISDEEKKVRGFVCLNFPNTPHAFYSGSGERGMKN